MQQTYIYPSTPFIHIVREYNPTYIYGRVTVYSIPQKYSNAQDRYTSNVIKQFTLERDKECIYLLKEINEDNKNPNLRYKQFLYRLFHYMCKTSVYHKDSINVYTKMESTIRL